LHIRDQFASPLFSYGSPPIAVYWTLVQHIPWEMRISDCGLGEEMRIADCGSWNSEMGDADCGKSSKPGRAPEQASGDSAIRISHFPVGVSNKAELLKLEVRRTI